MRLFLTKFLIFALSLLIVMALIEGFARFASIPKISNHNISAKAQDLVPQIDKNTFLIIGDSRLEWGIKPLNVKKQLNVENIKVINLAFPESNGIDILEYLTKHNIYPKAILMGYTSNYGRYTNHNLDILKYSFIRKIHAELKYFIGQTFYFNDQSFLNFLNGKEQYFKSHDYDEWGGVNVSEYGDYRKRMELQEKMYKEWKDSFSPGKLENYCRKVNELVTQFKEHKTKMLGIYLPVSAPIFDFEKQENQSWQRINYDRFYDLSHYTYSSQLKAPDSIYFYEGSHLSHAYSYIFSDTLGKMINRELFPDGH